MTADMHLYFDGQTDLTVSHNDAGEAVINLSRVGVDLTVTLDKWLARTLAETLEAATDVPEQVWIGEPPF